MINEGNFRLTGLKEIDITPEIDNLINSAKDFIAVCGYSFTNQTNIKSVLYKVNHSSAATKHCIFPITLFKGVDANRNRARFLIQNNISVSIEEKNHSKWIMNENEIYYGSANFTMDSLEKKIEVATFRSFIDRDPIKNEFTQFILASLNRMLLKSNRQHIKGYITRNKQLADQTKRIIKRFNPSIEKVIETVDAINMVRSSIYEIVENCFWYLDEKYYKQITIRASEFEELIKSINFRGRELIELKQTSREFHDKVKGYNQECDRFLNSIDGYAELAKDLLITEKIVPEFTKNNRKIIRENIKVFADTL